MVKHRSRFFLALLFAAGMASSANADALPRAKPEDVGVSSERLGRLDRVLQEKVANREIAGAVTLVARRGKIVYFAAHGYADVARKKEMTTDSIFRVYSMTKPIAAAALMTQFEEGRFQLNDPLAKYIPGFTNLRVMRSPAGTLEDTVELVRPPTIHDALRHTAGFSHGLTTDRLDTKYVEVGLLGLDVSLADMMTKLAELPLRHQPGEKWSYSFGPDVEARLVEIFSGVPFDRYLETRLFAPLGMTDTGFWVRPADLGRLATVYWVKDGKLSPLSKTGGHPEGSALYEPWSVNSYAVNHRRKGGSYGLVATAADYWRFAQMLSNRGELAGVRVLSPAVVEYMSRDHLGSIPMELDAPGVGYGLGLGVIKDSVAAGYLTNEGSFYWGGAAATSFWIDPAAELVVVFMTQHMGVPNPGSAAQQTVRSLVYSALLD